MKYLLLFIFSSFLLTAQNHSGFDAEYQVKKGYAVVLKNKKYGIINRNKKIVTPIIYDRIDVHLLKEFNYSVACKDNKCGIINIRGEIIAPLIYDYIHGTYWNFKNGYAVVTNGTDKRKDGMINMKGEVILPVIYDAVGQYLRDGYTLIQQDKKQGIVNKKGHITVPLGTYDWINEQTENKGLISVYKDKKKGTIRLDGKVIHEPIYNNIDTDFETNFAVISKDEKYGIINKKRKIITPLIYDYIYEEFENGYAVVLEYDDNKNNKYGIINTKNRLVAPVVYDEIDIIDLEERNRQLAVVKKDEKYGLLNPATGKIIAPVDYLEIWTIYMDEYGIVKLLSAPEAGREPEYYKKHREDYQSSRPNQFSMMLGLLSWTPAFSIIKINGKQIIPPRYSEIFFSEPELRKNGYFVVEDKETKKEGVINIKGNVILPAIYDELSVNEEDDNDRIESIKVKKDNKHGMFNKKGKVLLPVEYNTIDGYFYETYKVKKNELYGLVDTKGTILIPVIYDDIDRYQSGGGFIKVKKNGLYGAYFAKEGKKTTIKKILSTEYDEISNLYHENNQVELIKIKKDGLYGVYNREGNLVVSVLYDNIKSYNNGVFFVEQNKQFGLLKLNGEMLLPFQSNAQIRYNYQSKKWELLENDVWRNIEEQIN